MLANMAIRRRWFILGLLAIVGLAIALGSAGGTGVAEAKPPGLRVEVFHCEAGENFKSIPCINDSHIDCIPRDREGIVQEIRLHASHGHHIVVVGIPGKGQPGFHCQAPVH